MQPYGSKALNRQNQWYRLDNAGKIYPAIANARWNSIFRLSITLTQVVDPILLQKALENAIRRFDNMRLRLRKGIFWYYFEVNDNIPKVQRDVQNPFVRMRFEKNKGYMFRVRWYHKRISVEIFHALTDGTGGMIFLKSLTAEYLRLTGVTVSNSFGVMDIHAEPDPEEMEDGYRKYHDPDTVFSRMGRRAWQFKALAGEKDFAVITSGIMPADRVLALAHSMELTVTELLASVLLLSIQKYQSEADPKTKRPIRISVPVNMRGFYPSKTLRNFSLFIKVGIEPGLGTYDFDEIAHNVRHTLRRGLHKKYLNGLMAANVSNEKSLLLRIMPLFLKNIGLQMGYRILGESQYTMSLSNLGRVAMPEEMAPLVEKAELILGPPRADGVNCGVASCGNQLVVNFTRNIVQPDIEREFFRFLVQKGIHVKVENNE